MSQARKWVVVPAAGIGRRVGGEIPKQYLPLAGRTVIEWSLAPFLARADFAQIVVVVGQDDRDFGQLSLAADARIRVTTGGRQRSDSVLCGLRVLPAAADDWVLVHDAARPCLTSEDLDRLVLEVGEDSVGGILAAPVADTLKSAYQGRIQATVPREGLWRALTPQMFRYGVLCSALSKAAEDGSAVTDEAAAIERQGFKPKLVIGRADNLKITIPDDLAYACSALTSRRQMSAGAASTA